MYMKTTFKNYQEYCDYLKSSTLDQAIEIATQAFYAYNPYGVILKIYKGLDNFKKECLDPIEDPIELIQAIKKLGVDSTIEQQILFHSTYDQVVVLHSEEYDNVFYSLDNMKEELMKEELFNYVFNEDF